MISLVTGVGGFVGPYLASHLVSSGHRVFGIERRVKGVDGCRVFPCDVLDRDAVFAVFDEVRPGFVFHLAAVSSVAESLKDPELSMRVNVEGTRNVLDAVLRFCPGARVLVVSTAHVYGIPGSIPLREDHPLNPVSPYAVSRVGQEKLALQYFRERGLRVVVSRSFNHVGPGQPQGFMCSDFARQVAAAERGGSDVIEVGDLSSRRDFTDVRDVVRAYLLAVGRCAPGEIYNVCSGSSYSAAEVLGMFLGMARRQVRVVETRGRREGDIPVLVGDNSKFVSATGWRPVIPFEQTLSDVLGYWRESV